MDVTGDPSFIPHFQMVNMTAHDYNSMKITKKNSKTNLSLKKPGDFNNVTVKNYSVPPELPSKHVILHHKQVAKPKCLRYTVCLSEGLGLTLGCPCRFQEKRLSVKDSSE